MTYNINMELKDVIQRIGYFRNEKNMSARDLSFSIDKAENYINRLESSHFNVPTSVLLEIIETLEVSPEQFFASNYRTFKMDGELYNLIKNLPLEKKKILIDLIKHM